MCLRSRKPPHCADTQPLLLELAREPASPAGAHGIHVNGHKARPCPGRFWVRVACSSQGARRISLGCFLAYG